MLPVWPAHASAQDSAPDTIPFLPTDGGETESYRERSPVRRRGRATPGASCTLASEKRARRPPGRGEAPNYSLLASNRQCTPSHCEATRPANATPTTMLAAALTTWSTLAQRAPRVEASRTTLASETDTASIPIIVPAANDRK